MSIASVAKQLHLPKATVELLAKEGSGLSAAQVKTALQDAKQPAGPKDVAAARTALLALASELVEQKGESTKALRTSIDTKKTELTHGGASARASPAFARLSVDPKVKKEAENLADGPLFRFLARRDLAATEVKGKVLAEAVAELNANIRTTSGEPAYPEPLVAMAVAMLVQRGVSFAGRAPEGPLPALDALDKDPVGVGTMLARILTRANRHQHTFPVRDAEGRGSWDMRSDLHVWVEHRGFRAGVLELLARLAAGEKMSDAELDAKLKPLVSQTSEEYRALLQPNNAHNQALYEELRGDHAQSEPRSSGFSHALRGLVIADAVANLGELDGARAFASYVKDSAGTPEFSRTRQAQFMDQLFG